MKTNFKSTTKNCFFSRRKSRI